VGLGLEVAQSEKGREEVLLFPEGFDGSQTV